MNIRFGEVNNLPQKASAMYRMLAKIASNKEVWTLGEVRRLLSSISRKRWKED